MKRMQMFVLVLAAVTLVLQGAAFAETLSGKVVSVDQVMSTVTVSIADPATGTAKDEKVTVKSEATASLEGLTAGDEVELEAEKDAVGGWTASKVTKKEAAAAPAVQ